MSRETIDRSTNAAGHFDKNPEIIRQLFAPVSEALIDDAEIAPGHSVLDVATGAGEPALRIAGFVGPKGEVVGIDPVVGSIEASRRAAERLSLDNARFETARADNLPFPDNRFDAVVSRFGVMFFPSPIAGVREMLRVLKPGKKMAFAVWHFRDDNPFHNVLARIVDPILPPPELPPDAPDPFRFAAPGKLQAIVADAGAADPMERLFRFSIDVPLSPEDFWDLRMEMSDKLRERLATLQPGSFQDVKRRSIAAFQGYSSANGLSFPAEVRLVSARK
ncbi:putative ubiquinone/menaquinone biosynthesis methyltransferase UbiE (plasmid) [Gemmatirosa kalamazoonensis]|uniref:Putative ubiquinone/menaquinone biosynthesis methyltransferase UbiE n=1 Tax=Gemmatirosa kalamazoonensis TaxID=861299 RepID=W0RRG9_9BACT|nr:class I SAM-dependent methyltransferase [Gemmatirosa kalamazoonensis]AHG92915.1 putative ubiquinone/menaquinone biosynthesis methyltransferase UbiE [Gemmatirosa kalamazoonensis]